MNDKGVLDKVFRPRRLGQLSKDYAGQKVNTVAKNAKPDYKRIDYTEDGRKMKLPEENKIEKTFYFKLKKMIESHSVEALNETTKSTNLIGETKPKERDWNKVKL